MTRDEIKQTFNMRDILAKCGLPEPNRAGFIKCPFHKGDHDASLKIYDINSKIIFMSPKEIIVKTNKY